jgi:hypothetical protein
VPRRVKDFIEISEFTSLDDLIKFLETIRDTLPGDGEPELKIRGDDIFGHRLTISFLRELTAEEASLEARYTGAALPEPDEAIEQLREKLDKIPFRDTARRRS